MNQKHLLWWIFDFLVKEHPDVLDEMLAMEGEFGDDAEMTVTEALQEAFSRYRESLK